MKRKFRVALVATASIALFLGLAGASSCTQKPLVSDVVFKISPTAQSIKVQLNFDQSVQSDLGGTFNVVVGERDYGMLEVGPSTSETPFNVGFNLNLDILNEQAFVGVTGVNTLPSGQPIPQVVGREMIQVKMKNAINPNFDIYAYVDFVGKQWLGVAMTLKFINNKYFPAGLSVIQNFLKDPAGMPQGSAAVFGPAVDSSGNMTNPGGIAVFANVVSLIKNATKGGSSGLAAAGVRAVESGETVGGEAIDSPLVFVGPNAEYYEKNPAEAQKLADSFRELLLINTTKSGARNGK